MHRCTCPNQSGCKCAKQPPPPPPLPHENRDSQPFQFSLSISSDEDEKDSFNPYHYGDGTITYSESPRAKPSHSDDEFSVRGSDVPDDLRVLLKPSKYSGWAYLPRLERSTPVASVVKGPRLDHFSSAVERSEPVSMSSESFKALSAIATFSSETIVTSTLEQSALERFAIDERFQSIMDLPETTSAMQLHKYVLLSQLSEDFMLQVRQHGRTIISEMFLPVEERTIKPIELKGVAGGTKFVHQGILFKCAVDKQKSAGSNDFIYGGETGASFEDAQEACGHELKGAINYYRFRRLGVSVPIQATVDFWGYKLSAMPFLRLARHSLIYGSDDGGGTIHADVPAFNLVMKKVATQLHLATHIVNGTRIDAAGDVEGHRGENGRVYLLDLARTFPPEHPLACKHLERPPQSVFFCFLRPEFLQLLKQRGFAALSPDSLTGWGASDPDQRVHSRNLFNATKHLFDEVIPAFAGARDGLSVHEKGAIVLRCQAEFHSAGINVRHAGLVRKYFRCPRARKALLMEMVARVLKNILRRWFRLTAQCHPNSEYKMREVLLLFLNLVANPSPKSTEFWAEHVTKELLQKFGDIALEPREKEDLCSAVKADVKAEEAMPYRNPTLLSAFSLSRTDVNNRPPISEVVIYVAEMTGVHFSPNCLIELSRSSWFEFCGADVAGMEPRTKHMSIVNFADAQLLAHQAKLGEHSISFCLRLLHLACGLFQHALQSDPLNDEMKTACATSDKKFQGFHLEIRREFGQADTTFLQAARDALREPDVWSLRVAQENLGAVIELWSHRLGYEKMPDRFQLWGSSNQRMLLELAELLWIWERKVLELRAHLQRTQAVHREPHDKNHSRHALVSSPRSRSDSLAVTDEISAIKAAFLAWVRMVALGHNVIEVVDTQLQAELHSQLLEALDVKALRAAEWFVGIANYHAKISSVRLTPILSSVDESTGRTPLFFAVEREAVECVPFLVRAGSNLEHRDVYGNTPFLFACHRRLFRMMSLLAQLGSNIYAEMSPPEENSLARMTVLDYAERQKDGELIQHFRTLQADADKDNHMLRTKAAIVQELIKRMETDVDYLAVLIDVYLSGLQKDGLLKLRHFEQIFGNILEVRTGCLLLLASLYKATTNGAWSNRSCLAPVFEETIEPYSSIIMYCRNLNSALRVLDVVSNPILQKHFVRYAEQAQQQVPRLPVDADLSLPFLLEVPRAQLCYLVNTLTRSLDSTPPSHGDYGPLQTIAIRFDQLRAQAEYEAKCVDDEAKVAMVEQQFKLNPGFSDTRRFLIKEGMLIKKSRNADHRYMFFLFSDMLAYASKIGLTKKFKLHRVIPLDRSFLLRESPSSNDEVARTFAIVSAHKSFVIVTDSPESKQEWVAAINQALSGAIQSQSGGSVPIASLRPLMEQVGEQAECPLCKKTFSWFNRRYHCKSCGTVVCNACSRGRRAVTGERICSLCSVYEVHRPRSYSIDSIERN